LCAFVGLGGNRGLHLVAKHFGLSCLELEGAMQSGNLTLQVGPHFARHGCLLMQISQLALELLSVACKLVLSGAQLLNLLLLPHDGRSQLANAVL
jgi:hypothetical protein